MIHGIINEILAHKPEKLWSIKPEATVFEAIEIMATHNIGALPVLSGGKLLGIISERDYTRKVALKGKSSKETRVREILAPPVIASPSDTVEECMRLMTTLRVRHLPIVQGDELIGLVSIGDLVNWIINAQTSTIHQLESYISGHYPGAD
jgi:CBS domain-containing protein